MGVFQQEVQRDKKMTIKVDKRRSFASNCSGLTLPGTPLAFTKSYVKQQELGGVRLKSASKRATEEYHVLLEKPLPTRAKNIDECNNNNNNNNK